MATLKEIQGKVDLVMPQIWAHIQERQEIYLAAHGVYFQGLPTHLVKPADGADVAPDGLSSKPTDQAESWHDAGFVLPDKLPMAVTINVYESPDGHGYEVVLRVRVNDRQYRRVLQHGPETWRERDWVEEVNNGQATASTP